MAPACLGVHRAGGYADHVLVPHSRYLIDIGDLDPAQIAPCACSGLTTYAALKIGERTYRQHPVVIFGAGGLGLMCPTLIKALGGAGAIVVDIDPAKRQAALEAGALAAIDGAAPRRGAADHQGRRRQAAGRHRPGGRARHHFAGLRLPDQGRQAHHRGPVRRRLDVADRADSMKALSIISRRQPGRSEELMELVRAGKVPPMPVHRYAGPGRQRAGLAAGRQGGEPRGADDGERQRLPRPGERTWRRGASRIVAGAQSAGARLIICSSGGSAQATLRTQDQQ